MSENPKNVTVDSAVSAPARRALVTGASTGIGAATVRLLRSHGWEVVATARRVERLEALAAETGCTWVAADLQEPDDVERLASEVLAEGPVDAVVNNAGGAIGLESIAESSLDDWDRMYEINVAGTVRVTKAFLPSLLASTDNAAGDNAGLVVNIGSVAGWTPYAGGAGYNAAKHGVRAFNRVLRLENPGTLRVTEIDPGRVATEEFSLNRFRGDAEKAAEVYADKLNLSAEDIAEAVRWVAALPAHMNIDTMQITPRDQV
mgnify:CR=1 FL=1